MFLTHIFNYCRRNHKLPLNWLKKKNNTFSCSHFLLVQRRTFFLFLNFFLAYDKDETQVCISCLQNSNKILVLGPHLCTRIWAHTMTGLLKKPLSICRSVWKEIQNALPLICWFHWGHRTLISVLLHKHY